MLLAGVRIFLPPDYFCSVVGNGTADPDNSSDIFVWALRAELDKGQDWCEAKLGWSNAL